MRAYIKKKGSVTAGSGKATAEAGKGIRKVIKNDDFW